MKAKFLMPLALGFFVYCMPIWAEPITMAEPLVDASIENASNGPDGGSIASVPELPTGFYSDTLPMLALNLSRINVRVDIAFFAQEAVVEPGSADGAGVMLTFKAAHP